MAIDSYSLTVPASGSMILQPGNYFYVVGASAAFTVSFQTRNARETFTNILAGLLFARLAQWSSCVITAVAGTTVNLFYGSELPRADRTEFIPTGVSIGNVVGGVQQIGIAPAATLNATTGPTVLATASSVQIPANTSRRRIRIFAAIANTGAIYAQSHGSNTAGQGLGIAAGTTLEIDGTYTFDLRNDTGANQSYSLFEEQ